MGNWTQADVDRVTARRSRPAEAPISATPIIERQKYRNVKTVTFDGEKFDSKREAARWLELKARQQAGEIRALERQVEFDLMCPNPTRDGFAVVSQYVADFVYILCETGKQVIEDAKGQRTRRYLLKRKWLELQDGITITEV
jgi:hypothetical protein